MGVLGNNINRVKNILAGKYTDKAKVSVGYEKKRIKHVKGDIVTGKQIGRAHV